MDLTDKNLVYTWGIIEIMPPGSTILIANHANNTDIFIACAEKWIDIYKLGEFNKKKTRFKKLEPIII